MLIVGRELNLVFTNIKGLFVTIDRVVGKDLF